MFNTFMLINTQGHFLIERRTYYAIEVYQNTFERSDSNNRYRIT